CKCRTEPVILEFPELAGHFRRDYWLAIISEILCVHRFVRKFDISGIDKEETILKAVLSILRLQAIEELAIPVSNRFESLLMFNLCDKLPGGDVILETLAGSISLRRSAQVNQPGISSARHSMSPFTVLSNLGVVSPINKGERLFVGEIVVGEMSALQKVVTESMNNYKKVELAQATVDGVKVDGLDTNLAVMKVYSQQN
ncbi:Os05g0264200, partial [Oryza sativa Japonica Group]